MDDSSTPPHSRPKAKRGKSCQDNPHETLTTVTKHSFNSMKTPHKPLHANTSKASSASATSADRAADPSPTASHTKWDTMPTWHSMPQTPTATPPFCPISSPSMMRVKVRNITVITVSMSLEIGPWSRRSSKIKTPHYNTSSYRTALENCCSITQVPKKSDRKSTRLNSSHVATSYAVSCLKKT